jgi:hypothetical protein
MQNTVFRDLENILRGRTGKNLEIGILSAENEMGTQLPDAVNNQRNEDLFKKLSKLGGRVFRLQGNFGGINENSFLATGIPLETLKKLAFEYKQQAFIYGNGKDDDVIFHYMELKDDDEEEPDYESVQIRRTFIYKPTARENYSLYKGVKFIIPFFDNDYTDIHWEELSDEEKGIMPRGEDDMEHNESSRINKIKNLIESLKITEGKKVKIKVKHSDLLEIPEGKNFWNMPLKHYVDLVEKKSYAKVIRALNNIAVWHKSEDPEIGKRAEALMAKLKNKFRKEDKD